jgi:WD40 repeat protein
MELVNDFTCQPSRKMQNIILGIQNNIVAVPHQTFGRHVGSHAEPVDSTIDRLAFNSLNGQFFIANNNRQIIKTVDITNKIEIDLVNQHVLNIKSMAFDYLANNLYWVDDMKSTIEVFSLNTKKQRAIFTLTDIEWRS